MLTSEGTDDPVMYSCSEVKTLTSCQTSTAVYLNVHV